MTSILVRSSPERSTASGAPTAWDNFYRATKSLFGPSPANIPQGQYAVKILLDDPDQSKFPIGAQGIAAIYTSGEHGAWAALRKVSIRAHSWFNWLYPINF